MQSFFVAAPLYFFVILIFALFRGRKVRSALCLSERGLL
nr:MAG TPA: hypothetical protein [Caudoviricetes sp.]